ncbi:MAG: hypothetical protein QXW06_02080 [Thermoplasmata archaeon]
MQMHLKLCFHFHGYQPGDIILRRPGSPMETPVFLERRSPVGLKAGDRLIKGENWTGAMLGFYREIWRLFEEMGREGGSPGVAPFCSVDIEPATLQLLVQRHPGSFRALRRLIEERVIDLICTAPFHVLLPHVAPEEQRILADLAFSLHELLIAPEPESPIGFWFPEGLYSREAGRSVGEAFGRRFASRAPRSGGGDASGVGELSAGKHLFILLDRHQFLGLQLPQAALSANFVLLNGERVIVFGRDRALSDRWAFREGTIPELVGLIISTHTDDVKEKKGIEYALTMASDLESLASSADQGERLRTLRRRLREVGVELLSTPVFLHRKLTGEYRRWEGEMEDERFRVEIREFSSWSDYMDQGVDYSSDTRWTGLRRWDGLVISRVHRGTRISQIWKQGFMKVQERVERVVRRTVLDGLGRCMAPGTRWGPEQSWEFLRAYAGVVFAPLCLACSPPGADIEPDFRRIADTHLQNCRRDEEAALLARAYYEMLMSLRSCPRFWDNMDTRVTFQGSVLMAHALLDLAEACERLGLREGAQEALRIFLTNLVDFHEVYRYYNLGSLFGLVGWEVSEDAWHMAVQSEVPERSGYDVVKRAALFVAIREGTDAASRALAEVRFDEGQVVADTAHIEGEGHGQWENANFCENRARA